MQIGFVYCSEKINAKIETEPENTKIICQLTSMIIPATNGIMIEAMPFTMTTFVRNYAPFS